MYIAYSIPNYVILHCLLTEHSRTRYDPYELSSSSYGFEIRNYGLRGGSRSEGSTVSICRNCADLPLLSDDSVEWNVANIKERGQKAR